MSLKKIFRALGKRPLEKVVRIGNFDLVANFDHLIQNYLEENKYYSRNFSRIAKYIENKYPVYTIIDVGANIGDSVALLRTEGSEQFVHLIEGDPIFVELLTRNSSLFDKILIHNTFLGETTSKQHISIQSLNGTSNINVGIGDQNVSIIKLDELIKDNKIDNIKLLKTDTDGFDFKILRGAFDSIKRQKPVLFFEYDSVFLNQQNDSGLAIFEDFKSFGYNKILYYDNFGKFLLSTTLSNTFLIEQLYAYINRKESGFPYYDVVLFHENDDELADDVISKEMIFFN